MPETTIGAEAKRGRQPKGRSRVRTTRPAEVRAVEQLEAEDYFVTKRGFPTFLAMHIAGDGPVFVDPVFVYTGPLSEEQKQVHDALVRGGVKVRVIDP